MVQKNVKTLKQARSLAKKKNGNLYHISDSHRKKYKMKNRYLVQWASKR
jgi:hypothetical protein